MQFFDADGLAGKHFNALLDVPLLPRVYLFAVHQVAVLQALVAEVRHKLRVLAHLLEDLSVYALLQALVGRFFPLRCVPSVSSGPQFMLLKLRLEVLASQLLLHLGLPLALDLANYVTLDGADLVVQRLLEVHVVIQVLVVGVMASFAVI